MFNLDKFRNIHWKYGVKKWIWTYCLIELDLGALLRLWSALVLVLPLTVAVFLFFLTFLINLFMTYGKLYE